MLSRIDAAPGGSAGWYLGSNGVCGGGWPSDAACVQISAVSRLSEGLKPWDWGLDSRLVNLGGALPELHPAGTLQSLASGKTGTAANSLAGKHMLGGSRWGMVHVQQAWVDWVQVC